MRRTTRLSAVALAVWLAAAATVEAQAVAGRAAPVQALPTDPAFVIRTLGNGVRVYFRHNARPARRVELRLVVRAGSMHEADDERGFAHLVEHMAFNGTTHFAAGELVKTFEQQGVRFGAHVNARTSFDETVYQLRVPTDDEALVGRALQALADFGRGIRFDEAEVARERPIVVEEWRQQQGAGSRLQAKQAPVLYHGSRYATRFPIGDMTIVGAATPAGLRRFYDTWYRPDRFAVIVVGDIEPAAAARLVDRHFAGLAGVGRAGPEPDRTVPLHRETLTSLVTDPEVTSTSASLLRKFPETTDDPLVRARTRFEQGMVARLLNARLGEVARRPEAPFLGASLSTRSLSPSVRAAGVSVRVADGKLVEGLEAALVESRRALLHGFLPAELERAKRGLRASIETAYAERDKTESSRYAAACEEHFLDDEPLTPPDWDRTHALGLVDQLTLEHVQAAARGLLADEHRVLLVVAPEKAGSPLPALETIQAAIARSAAATLTAWEESAIATTLMATLPVPGRVTARREIPALGVTVLTLSNGIEAWIKPTDFANQDVLFTLQAPGGTTLAPIERFPEASISARYVTLAGVGGITAPDLRKMLEGRMAGASPTMGLVTHGVSGRARIADLETALQLLHLSITSPNRDPASLDLIKRQTIAGLENRRQSPQAVFGDRLAAINLLEHYTTRVPDRARVEALDLDAILTFYRERFANAADFRLFVVGSVTLDALTPLLERYVASLPVNGNARRSAVPDPGLRFPERPVVERVVKGREPASRTVMTFYAETGAKPDPNQGALISILQTRLREALREQLGQTYSVSVGQQSYFPLRGYGAIVVSFGSAPEHADSLQAAVLREVDRLVADGPTPAEIEAFRAQERRTRETALKQNGFWLAILQAATMMGLDPQELIDSEPGLAALTPESVKAKAAGIAWRGRYTAVSLVPEAIVPPAAGGR